MLQRTTTLQKIAKMTKRIRVIAGSQGAGKTFSILLLLINHCSGKPNKRCMIVSQELAKMRTNIIPDFLTLMKASSIFDSSRWNSTECVYTFPNGSNIRFYGANKDDAGKGTRLDILFVNEANKITFEAYRELSSRSSNIFIDYNPNIYCWIDSQVIPRSDCDFLRVTWRNNEMLGEAEKSEIKRYAELAFESDGKIKDEYWHNVWLVYSEGRTGHFVGTILTNIEVGDYPDDVTSIYALDIGYKDDDACVRVGVDNKNRKIYVDEILYENGLSSFDLATKLKKTIGSQLIVCDSAAAKTIADLKQQKINAVSSEKNKIVDDIKKLRGYKIVISPRSVNLQQELNNWRWKDKDGKSIPADGDIHLIDAMRYGFGYLTKTTTPATRVVKTNDLNYNRKKNTFKKII